MAIVDLTRTAAGLAGAVGELPFDLQFDAPNSHAGVRGVSMGVTVEGHWHIESNFENVNPVGRFIGLYDDSQVLLCNEAHLTPDYALRHADLSGSIGGEELMARIAPVDAPAHGPMVLGVDGQIDRKVITLLAAVHTGRTARAQITGAVDGRQVNLVATRSGVAGTYDAPAPLLPLLVMALAYFI